jgi:hypothetical protein
MDWTLRHPNETVFSALSKIGGLLALLRISGFFMQLYHKSMFKTDLKKLLLRKKWDNDRSTLFYDPGNINATEILISKPL